MTKHKPLFWDKPSKEPITYVTLDSESLVFAPETVTLMTNSATREYQEMVAQIHRDQAELAFEWFCQSYGIAIPDDPSAREQLRLSLLASIRAADVDGEDEWGGDAAT